MRSSGCSRPTDKRSILPGALDLALSRFLRKHDFITTQQEKFARGIYALISDEGVHPLMRPPEARPIPTRTTGTIMPSTR